MSESAAGTRSSGETVIHPTALVDDAAELGAGVVVGAYSIVGPGVKIGDGSRIGPHVLIIEAMAQVGGLLLMDHVEDPEDKVVYFMSLDEVKWRRPVIPGDQIVFELELLQFRRGVCKMAGVGKVDGNVVAEAQLMARVMDR